mgnify:CR=1 FL=1
MINEGTLEKLLSSLESYNGVANNYATSISTALNVVGTTLLGIMLYIELANLQKKLSSEQGILSIELLMSVVWKYVIALAFVMLSDKIIDSFIWFANAIGHIINSIPIDGDTSSGTVPSINGDLSWSQSMIINIVQVFSNFALWCGEIVTDILIFMRFLTLYVYKMIAGVMFASFVSDEWSSIAKSYIRQVLALVIQGFALILIIKVFQAIRIGEVLEVTSNGDDFAKNLANQFMFIVKSVAYVGIVLGSQRLTQKMVGG